MVLSVFRGLAPGLDEAASELFRQCQAAGLRPRVTSVVRSRQQQQILYDRYLRGLNPYPVLPPGQSLHERGLAFDMVVDQPALVGAAWQRAGGQWGGAKDPVHYQYRV